MNKSVCQSHSSSGKFDQKEYARKWRLAHKDYYRRYRERNWEKVREYEKNWKKKYCKQHPGKKREDWKKWLRAHPGWKRITEHGYLIVSCPSHPYANSQGMVYVHRLAAEKMLGRFLNLDEIVHHQDGNRLNNDPGNLMIMSAREHALLHASRKGGTKE